MALLICLWGFWLHGIPFVNKTLLKNAGSLLVKRHSMLQLNLKIHRMVSWKKYNSQSC